MTWGCWQSRVLASPGLGNHPAGRGDVAGLGNPTKLSLRLGPPLVILKSPGPGAISVQGALRVRGAAGAKGGRVQAARGKLHLRQYNMFPVTS